VSVDIPNYRIIEKIGVGANSRIFRARSMRNGQDYAVKIVKIVKPEDANLVEMLRTEQLVGSGVDHPAIRRVFELRLMRQRLRVRGAILFMEFVTGVPMADKEFRRPLDDVLRLFIEVAQGLHAMHLAGFVHADLKPQNILVTPEDTVKIIDLGQSARMYQAKTRVQGTMDYVAPEQVQRKTLDARTDVFGLGATLHRILTGKPIATEMNQTVTVHSASLIGKRVTEMREAAMGHLPTCVSRMVEDCCQQNPTDRIADIPTLIERLGLARTIITRQAASGGLKLEENAVRYGAGHAEGGPVNESS
jgi:serine/threonine-protein kinase